MSKNINKEENTQTVSSKYFTSKSVMDESLSDFQEPKILSGSRNTLKKTKPQKSNKAPKKIRGQKDIRTSLRSKKSELESYSKDFDHVCKEAGLDVDSEQLQLAIALSKSLQESTSNSSENPKTSQSLSSLERVKNIRSTLLEYGFKVPNIKITTNRKFKKNKHYKLLFTSEDAKKQIISAKYSQVLFENITPWNPQNSNVDVTHIQLYNLATKATYSILKNINTFYVDGLLEKSTTTGNLLKDWSEIPGRPVSPKLCEPTSMNFSEIECSQDELDIVLSGSLKRCKNVIKCKQEEASISVHKYSEQNDLITRNSLNKSMIILLDDGSLKSNDGLKVKEIEIRDLEEPKTFDKTLKTNSSQVIDVEETITTVNLCRSCSPDLFDDEPSIVIDNTTELFSQEKESFLHKKPIISSSNNFMDLIEHDQGKHLKQSNSVHSNPNLQITQNTNVTKRLNDFMEITECVEVQCPITNFANENSTLKLSENITKRKSNDFMEITDCVVSPVQPLPIKEKTDLTQSLENGHNTDVSGADEILRNECNIETSNDFISQNLVEAFHINKDVTMENKTEHIALKYLCNEKTPKIISVINENNIDLTESPDLVKNYTVEDITDKTIESMDLTQSSNTSDELPFVSLKTNKKSQDDTIIVDPKDYEGIEKSVVLKDNDEILDLTQNIMHERINRGSQESQSNRIDLDCTQNEQILEDILDLTQDIIITSRHNSKTSHNTSFFDNYVHNHSDDNEMLKEITCNGNFHKGSDPKEILCLDVSTDTSSKIVERPDLVARQSPNLKSGNPIESDDIDLTQNSESSEELNQSLQNNDNSKPKNHIIDSQVENEKEIEMEINKDSPSDVDLTQHSEYEEFIPYIRNKNYDESESDSDCTNEIEIVKNSQRCSSLGKKDDVSIDYDELYDNLVNRHSHSQQSGSSPKSATNIVSNVSNTSKDISNCSQTSEVFVISDNELDYSMHQSKIDKPVDNFLFGGISIMNELSGLGFRKSTNYENISATTNNNNVAPAKNYVDNVDSNQIEIEHERKTPVKHKRVNELATPQKPSCSEINTVITPYNSHYVIKTIDVTPMPKYEMMTLQELHDELDKFGVKPFKRKRAIQLLTHIYNQTHPIVEPYSDEESPCKRRKTNDYESPRKPSPRKLTPRKNLSPKKTVKSPRKVSTKKAKENTIEKVGEESNVRLNDREVIETPVIKEIECSPDDWVFQKKEKAKVHSCRVPLHIAFHNYVSTRRGLKEAILCYEPINIDDIHKDLVAYGHRYDPKDLLKFMDKKCITVKTTDNDARNQKR